MPIYHYHCPDNGTHVEAVHSMRDSLDTWGELCAHLEMPLGDTPANAPVERLIYPPSLAFPKGDAALKDLGFTKLVRRDKGVYENVTARDGESKVMDARDPNSMPDFKKTIAS